nr:hypothetical protein [Tanacetum cinerariifolium]
MTAAISTTLTPQPPPHLHNPTTSLTIHTPPSPPRPPPQRWLLQPLSPSWQAGGHGSVTTATASF